MRAGITEKGVHVRGQESTADRWQQANIGLLPVVGGFQRKHQYQ